MIGAGMGGLTAAALLSARGFHVTVVEKAMSPGGKMRQLSPLGRPIDAGPTVFTMRWVFDEIFAASGDDLEDHLELSRLDILARHAWPDGSRLDLHADLSESAEAIAAFAGPEESARFIQFSRQAAQTYRTLEQPFLRGSRTSPLGLTWRIGPANVPAMASIRPFSSYWRQLTKHFRDPRLRQLFGRYATYSGASPFAAPATLMLIAHVEQQGVWSVKGGMDAVARAVEGLARKHGAEFRYGAGCHQIEVEQGRASGIVLDNGERLSADRIVANCDPSAIASGLFGAGARTAVRAVTPNDRSLSALCWVIDAPAKGFPLSRHNVFFSGDYRHEFAEIGRTGRPALDPTVYLCAQDRDQPGAAFVPGASERMQIIVNAPPNGDIRPLSEQEIATCETRMFDRLTAAGLTVDQSEDRRMLTTPTAFDQLFPATGGALYGRATHGWASAFRRPGSRTAIPGLYLAGGATHPGAGVPMAALSGCRAAESIMLDCSSTLPSRPAAIAGGISTPSATTGATG